MPRIAKLCRKPVGKHVYWATTAGGRCIYFGNVAKVPQAEAQKAFDAYLKGLNRNRPMEFVKIVWRASDAKASEAEQG